MNETEILFHNLHVKAQLEKREVLLCFQLTLLDSCDLSFPLASIEENMSN